MFFYTPFFLILLLIPFGFLIRSLAKLDEPFKNIMTKQIREKLFLPAKIFNTKTKFYIFLLVVILFIIALARPVKMLPSLDITETKPSVILAIDMSYSMNKTDIFPSRKEFAKEKAQIFIKKAIGFNIGLIFYANDAYMLYPLTQEREIPLLLLKDANITKKFSKNTNLFSALEASEFLLKKHQNKHIVLFSDGGLDLLREDELKYMRENDIMLSTLAITPTKNRALQILCNSSKGLYTSFQWSDSDIDKIINHIKNTKKSSQKVHLDIAQYEEYFSYPLALSLILMTLLFLPLRTSTLILFLVYFQPSPIHAGVFDFWYIYKAQKEIEQKNYTQAIKEYKETKLDANIYYNIAYSLYKDKKYNEAIKHYKSALGVDKQMNAKIYYNIATAYVRENKLDFAKRFYEKSFLIYPTKITRDNLIIIKLALKKQRKNLHKKYEKIDFKPISENAFSKNNPFSNYTIKLRNFIPSEEERWFQKVSKHNSPTHIIKIKTEHRSIDANISL